MENIANRETKRQNACLCHILIFMTKVKHCDLIWLRNGMLFLVMTYDFEFN